MLTQEYPDDNNETICPIGEEKRKRQEDKKLVCLLKKIIYVYIVYT